MVNNNKTMKNFLDSEIYQIAYKAMLMVFNSVISNLPKEELHDLKEQLRRSVKTIPRLIAKGYYKRFQKKEFQDCIDNAMEESIETIISLRQALDLYPTYLNAGLCDELIDTYDKINKLLGDSHFCSFGTSEEIKHTFSVGATLEEMEKELINKTLSHVGGNRAEAARMLGIGERTLYRKIDEYGLK
jgi:four helix bundle protein